MVYIMNNDFATTFNDFYLGLYTNPFEPETSLQAILAVCKENIGSVYTTQYEVVEGTDDRIRILWKGYAMSAQYYYKSYEPIISFLTKESENEFIIEADNNIYPQEIKFTKVSNPNHWFINFNETRSTLAIIPGHKYVKGYRKEIQNRQTDLYPIAYND